MTDDQIRAWLTRPIWDTPKGEWQLPVSDTVDCLTELLQYRELHSAIKWAVWVRDQSAESGWTLKAAFPDRDAADLYRRDMVLYDVLVLPANEIPALTAR